MTRSPVRSGHSSATMWRASAGQRTHRVPGREHNRFEIERLLQFNRQLALPCGDLERIFRKPGVVHRVIALLAVLLSPAVLDTPSARCAIDDIDTGKEHGMRHERLVIQQS